MTLEVRPPYISAGSKGGLKDITSASSYSGAASVQVHACDATTSWTGNNLHASEVTPATDGTVKQEGTASVKFGLKTNSSTSKAYIDLGSIQDWSPYRYLDLWIYVEAINISGANTPFDGAKIANPNETCAVFIEVASSSDLSSPHTSMRIADLPWTTWRKVSVPIETNTQVRTIGFRSNGTATAPNDGYRIYVDDVRKREYDQAERALEAKSTVLIPANYTPLATQRVLYLPSSKSFADFRPTDTIIANFDGEKRIRQYRIDETGTSDMSSELAQIFRRDFCNTYNLRVRFPADAFIRIDQDAALELENVVGGRIDFNGARFITATVGRGTPYLRLIGGNRHLELWHPRGTGLTKYTVNGQYMTKVTGGETTVGTGVELNAQNEAVTSHDTAPGADYDGYLARLYPGQHAQITAQRQMMFGVTLSDTAQVSNDCTVTIEDIYGTTYLTSTFTLTATPTEYYFKLDDGDIDLGFEILLRVKKATDPAVTGANTITVASVNKYGSSAFQNGGASNAGVQITNGASGRDGKNIGISIYYPEFEGLGGDRVQASATSADAMPEDVLVYGGMSRCCARQGDSYNDIMRLRLYDGVIREPGRSTLDFEPQGDSFCVDLHVKGMQFMNLATNNFSMINSGSGKVYNLRVEDCHGYDNHNSVQFLETSSQGGFMKGCTLQGYPGTGSTTNRGVAINIDSIAQNFNVLGNTVDGEIQHLGSGLIDGNTIRSASPMRKYYFGPNVRLGRNWQQRFARATLSGAHGAGSTTLTVTQKTWDFPSSGSLTLDRGTVDEEIVTYTGKTDTTFTGVSATANAHADGDEVYFDSIWEAGTYVGQVQWSGTVPSFAGIETVMSKQASGTFPAPAYHKLWHPSGMDMLTVPLKNLRGISTGSTIPNNRHGQGAPGAGVTSLAITFPTRTFYNPSYSVNAEVAGGDGGLANGTTYRWRIAGHNLYGGPRAPGAEVTNTMSAANRAVRLRLTGLRNSAGYLIQGVTVYRHSGIAGANATHRYDWLPTTLPYELSAAFRENLLDLTDLGATLSWTSVTGSSWGYPASTAVATSRTDDPQSGAWTSTVDETGYERGGATYKITIGDATWNHGGFWITSKTLAGFTANWVNATADANQTFEWFLEW